MGFVARTIFWLGLVYSAMPLDFASLVSDEPAAGVLAPCARGATDDCRRRIETLRKTVDAAAALGLMRPGGGSEPSAAQDPPPPKAAKPRPD